MNDEINRLLIAGCVILCALIIFNASGIIYRYVISNCIDDRQTISKTPHFVLLIIAFFGLWYVVNNLQEKNSNSELKKYLISIKNEYKIGNNQFTINVKNDRKYFYVKNKNGNEELDKSEFIKLNSNDCRNLKIYYSIYKNNETDDKKTQAQIDYEQLLHINEDDKNIHDYLEFFQEYYFLIWLDIIAGGIALITIIIMDLMSRPDWSKIQIIRTISIFSLTVIGSIITYIITTMKTLS